MILKINIKFHLLFTEMLVTGQEVQIYITLVDVVVLELNHLVVGFRVNL